MSIFIISGFILINTFYNNQGSFSFYKNPVSNPRIQNKTERTMKNKVLNPKRSRGHKIKTVQFDTTLVYLYVDREAKFTGGKKTLTKFLDEHLNYPDYAYNHNITGKVDVIFIVNINGSVSKVVAERSSGSPDLDNEAIRVVRLLSGKFKPARCQGRKVRSYARIPIIFELEE